MSEPLPTDAVNLDFNRTVCGLHGEVFRSRWPAGFPVFTVKAFQKVMSGLNVDEERKALGLDDDKRAIEALLDKRPLCCRLEPAELLAIYRDLPIGVVKRCKLCRTKRLGAPYQARVWGTERTKTYSHACFHCVVHRMRPRGN